MMENTFIEPYKNHRYPAEGHKASYLIEDGRILIAVKRDKKGLRRFREGIFQVARSLLDHPEIERGYLFIVSPSVSRSRMRTEWNAARQMFSPEIASRMAVAAVDCEGTWIEPEIEPNSPIRKLLESYSIEKIDSDSTLEFFKRQGQTYFEVLKVLINRWLRRQGEIPIGKLAEQVGCVYPTATQALKRIERRGYLRRHTNRSVELNAFPHESWKELLALSSSTRPAYRYADATGGRADLEFLINRLERINPPNVALGGVAAARYWHSNFDLHGIPRIDLCLHIPHKNANLDFLRKLDPALERVEDANRSAVVVLHPIYRGSSLFAGAAESPLPYADPIETVLDLHEMGLAEQAGRLLAHFRPELRLP